jgi:hypothetical protein
MGFAPNAVRQEAIPAEKADCDTAPGRRELGRARR